MSQLASRPTIRIAKVLMALVSLGFLLLLWPTTLGGEVAYVQVSGHSMDGTYRSGDLVIVRAQGHYAVGDIVAYRIPKGEFAAGAQVIHRIVGGNGTKGFTTQGDNKKSPDDWHPTNADVIGHAWVRVAGAGTWFSKFAQPLPLGVLCAGLTVVTMLIPKRRSGQRVAPQRLNTLPLAARRVATQRVSSTRNPNVPSRQSFLYRPSHRHAKR